MISAMEWFILTVLVLISLGDASVIPTVSSKASVEDGTPQLECLAGSEWESNCHYCRCSDSGVAECLKQSSCDDGVFIPKKASSFLVATDLPAGVECAAGSTWRSGCNVCVCSTEGFRVCSQNLCKDKEKEPEKHCAPDTAWMNDCNRCYCTEKGFGYCTQIGCLHSKTLPKDSELPTGKECAAGSSWQSGCSDCVCSAAGYPECIQRVCEEEEEEEREHRCALGTMWMDGCNKCYCNGNSFCTQIDCAPTGENKTITDASPGALGKNVPQEAKPVSPNKTAANRTCVSKAMFIKDCNICWCNDDGTDFFCTRKVCPNLLDLPDEPNVEDVPEVLSRKVRSTPQELPKACQPGQEFRLDCNKCLCDNEGLSFSCTRIDCVALNSAQANGGTRTKRDSPSETTETTSELVEIAMDCTPGSVFQRECNSCTCSQSGQNARCANAKCAQNHIDSDVHTTDPGFRCNPGEQFKRDCNDCTCTADGRSTFCTLHFCEDTMRQEFSP